MHKAIVAMALALLAVSLCGCATGKGKGTVSAGIDAGEKIVDVGVAVKDDVFGLFRTINDTIQGIVQKAKDILKKKPATPTTGTNAAPTAANSSTFVGGA